MRGSQSGSGSTHHDTPTSQSSGGDSSDPVWRAAWKSKAVDREPMSDLRSHAETCSPGIILEGAVFFHCSDQVSGTVPAIIYVYPKIQFDPDGP